MPKDGVLTLIALHAMLKRNVGRAAAPGDSQLSACRTRLRHFLSSGI
jgi:hypothetical protein